MLCCLKVPQAVTDHSVSNFANFEPWMLAADGIFCRLACDYGHQMVQEGHVSAGEVLLGCVVC